MNRADYAKSLRENTTVHYNCCQSVLLTFADEMGLSFEQAYALGNHFGSGMRHGATCGVLTGGLMVLGALGYDQKAALHLLEQFRQAHGATDCAQLLQSAQARGEGKKPHCDALVCQLVELLEREIATQPST